MTTIYFADYEVELFLSILKKMEDSSRFQEVDYYGNYLMNYITEKMKIIKNKNEALNPDSVLYWLSREKNIYDNKYNELIKNKSFKRT